MDQATDGAHRRMGPMWTHHHRHHGRIAARFGKGRDREWQTPQAGGLGRFLAGASL